MKYTKWIVNKSDIDSSGRSCHRIERGGRKEFDLKEDAKLISKAPEMYEALKEALYFFDMAINEYNVPASGTVKTIESILKEIES